MFQPGLESDTWPCVWGRSVSRGPPIWFKNPEVASNLPGHLFLSPRQVRVVPLWAFLTDHPSSPPRQASRSFCHLFVAHHRCLSMQQKSPPPRHLDPSLRLRSFQQDLWGHPDHHLNSRLQRSSLLMPVSHPYNKHWYGPAWLSSRSTEKETSHMLKPQFKSLASCPTTSSDPKRSSPMSNSYPKQNVIASWQSPVGLPHHLPHPLPHSLTTRPPHSVPSATCQSKSSPVRLLKQPLISNDPQTK